MSARGIEDSQDRGTSKRKSMMRPEQLHPEGRLKMGRQVGVGNPMPDEYVIDCMPRCGTNSGFLHASIIVEIRIVVA